MLDEINVNNLINKLKVDQSVELPSNGHTIEVSFSPIRDTLAFKSSVYQGFNFIPYSVRDCLTEHPPTTKSPLSTYLYVNEEAYCISLYYRGNGTDLQEGRLLALIEEFSHLASEWRRILDDYDKRDLVHVKVP